MTSSGAVTPEGKAEDAVAEESIAGDRDFDHLAVEERLNCGIFFVTDSFFRLENGG